MVNQSPLLEITNATKIYTKSGVRMAALRDVSLSLPSQPAKIVAIAGESGSGKTTLANAVLGFVPLTSGHVRFMGREIVGLRGREYLEYRRQVQAVFQDPFGVYNPFYRVRHVFDMPLKRFKLARSRRDADAMMEHALQTVGMRGSEVLDKYPHQLSGGQRQRIMIARAYLLRPKLMVADEPVSMVDASLRAMILDIMVHLRDEEGISFLYITHDLSTAYQVSDDICILYHGEVVERGNAQQVISNPQHEYSKLLISSIPVPDPTVKWDTNFTVPIAETL